MYNGYVISGNQHVMKTSDIFLVLFNTCFAFLFQCIQGK